MDRYLIEQRLKHLKEMRRRKLKQPKAGRRGLKSIEAQIAVQKKWLKELK